MFAPGYFDNAPSGDHCLRIPVWVRAIAFTTAVVVLLTGVALSVVGFVLHAKWNVVFWLRLCGAVGFGLGVGLQYIFARECCYPWVRRDVYTAIDTDT